MTDSTQTPAPDTLSWKVDGWTPDRPFTGYLVWSAADETVLRILLDPILVRDLLTSLAVVHEAQRVAVNPTPGDDPGSLTLPEQPDGTPWQILDWSPQAPFGGHLTWSDGDADAEPVVRVSLDPILVRDLCTELATILLAQRNALGFPDTDLTEPAPAAAPAVSLTKAPATNAPADDTDAVDESPDEDDLPEDEDEEEEEEEEEIDTRRWWVRHPVKATFAAIPLLIFIYCVIAGSLMI